MYVCVSMVLLKGSEAVWGGDGESLCHRTLIKGNYLLMDEQGRMICRMHSLIFNISDTIPRTGLGAWFSILAFNQCCGAVAEAGAENREPRSRN
jgi:hypothetical protein